MNENLTSTPTSDVPWPTSDHRVPVPDTSMFSASAPTPAPTLTEAGAVAAQALHGQADRLREAGDEWVDGLRTTVREHPLACLAAAVAAGLVIARITR